MVVSAHAATVPATATKGSAHTIFEYFINKPTTQLKERREEGDGGSEEEYTHNDRILFNI